MDDLTTGWQLCQTRQTQDSEIVDFKAFLFVSKNGRLTRGKSDFLRLRSRSRLMSKNILVLAQFLVQNGRSL